MDLTMATALLGAASSAVDLFDKVADQVVRFIKKKPDPTEPPKQLNYKASGNGQELKVESHGQIIQVIRGEDLKNLPAEYYGHIQTLEESVKSYYSIWQQVYPHRDDSADAIVNAKVNKQLTDLVLKMKKDLTGIIEFLLSLGLILDDHYLHYRDVIQDYDGK